MKMSPLTSLCFVQKERPDKTQANVGLLNMLYSKKTSTEKALSGNAGKVAVCLVSMPYAVLNRPSLSMSLIKALLNREGIPSVVVYPTFWFAEEIGLHRYQLCAQHLSPTEFLVGEWTFSKAAFPNDCLNDEGYIQRIREAQSLGPDFSWSPERVDQLVKDLQYMRDVATDFIELAARRVLAFKPRIVGCTSTFEQHVASLALLRRIRQLDPTVITMMGGANCETLMGQATHQSFPWVDYVVSGEADGLIADLCSRVLEKGRDVPLDELPFGVFGPAHRLTSSTRDFRVAISSPPRAVFHDLDKLPTPDYGDYFVSLQASPLAPMVEPGLLLETSRGCWWGAIHQCTFCGLNGSGMTYRSKSPDRVISEIESLESQYNIHNFLTVDNILDTSYFQSVLPHLAESNVKRRFFYEIKANLKRSQIEMLRRAGITWLQPGIESLHTSVLKLMDKGVQGWQNILLLKVAREQGIRLFWSVLWGFPGEEDRWYHQMSKWIPLLEHLQPPGLMVRIRFDRYSVYHERAASFGLELRTIPAMSYVYPLSEKSLNNLTYFFTAEGRIDPFTEGYHELTDEKPGTKAVHKAISRWRRRFWGRNSKPPGLYANDDGKVLRIFDSRKCARQARIKLTGTIRTIYMACDESPVEKQIPRMLKTQYDLDVSEEEVTMHVNTLKYLKLLLAIDGRLLALSTRGKPPQLPRMEEFPGGYVNIG